MKEITKEDWQKNPTPRMMWVWNDNEDCKEKRLVVHRFTSEDAISRFVAETGTGCAVGYWKHCAEIESGSRMTNYEVAKWIADGASCGEFRELKTDDSSFVFQYYTYDIDDENKPCPDCILVRSNGGEWREPYNIPPECISPTPDEIGG